jgi:FkbM family methyltransferase
MASVHSPIRSILKPILFKLLGKSFYARFQCYAKIKDIDNRLVEEKEMVLLPLFISKDSEAIDIGANYAYFTVRISKLAKKVYAYEPIPFTFKVCNMLVKHYKLNNVFLFQKGVGEKNEIKRFSVPVVDFGAISAGQAHMAERNNELKGKEHHYKFNKSEEYDCEVISIDNDIKDATNISFIKIDIEGAEYFALKGMKQILQQHKPVILIEINPFFLDGFNIKESDLSDCIRESGYETYMYDENLGKLILYTDSYVESNYILIHVDKLELYHSIMP